MVHPEAKITTYPPLPIADITPLELLVLSNVLDCNRNDDTLELFTDAGPRNPIRVTRQSLIASFDASARSSDSLLRSFLESHVLPRLPDGDVDPDTMVEIDLSTFPWQFIVQDILARSSTAFELVVIQWMNHLTQRPESFGASVSLITRKAIHHATSNDLLTHFRGRDMMLPAAGTATFGNVHCPNPPASAALEGYEASAFRALEAATCIWEAMLHFKKLHAAGRSPSAGIDQMVAVWAQAGWATMRRFACDLTAFALEVQEDLALVPNDENATVDSNFILAFVETLLWSVDGPHREDEPEEFLDDVTTALKRRR